MTGTAPEDAKLVPLLAAPEDAEFGKVAPQDVVGVLDAAQVQAQVDAILAGARAEADAVLVRAQQDAAFWSALPGVVRVDDAGVPWFHSLVAHGPSDPCTLPLSIRYHGQRVRCPECHACPYCGMLPNLTIQDNEHRLRCLCDARQSMYLNPIMLSLLMSLAMRPLALAGPWMGTSIAVLVAIVWWLMALNSLILWSQREHGTLTLKPRTYQSDAFDYPIYATIYFKRGSIHAKWAMRPIDKLISALDLCQMLLFMGVWFYVKPSASSPGVYELQNELHRWLFGMSTALVGCVFVLGVARACTYPQIE